MSAQQQAKLRIAFMGTPAFALPALKALHQADYDIVAVYCQPPKAQGRGLQQQACPVQQWADAQGLKVFTPKSLKKPEAQAEFAALNLDAAIIVAYGLILPKAILSAPKYGCINIHGSLLPRWRGAAPMQRALLAGDNETGITIMLMDEGLDTGPMLSRQRLAITADTTISKLHDVMAEIGAALLLESLPRYIEGSLTPQTQPEQGVTYAAKLSRDDGKIDWAQPAEIILRQLRALLPWPGVWFTLKDEIIKLHDAQASTSSIAPPATLLDNNFTVACGGGTSLRLLQVQRAGKKAVSGAEFLRGFALKLGEPIT